MRLLGDLNAEFILAEANGTALGYVQLRYHESAWVSGREAELEDVFVVDTARRHGVGQRMLEFAASRRRT